MEMVRCRPEIPDGIAMIATDLDGTALSEAGLTQRVKDSLENAIKAGYEVVVATGRPFSALPDGVAEIQSLKYVIASNGSHVRNLQTGDLIYENCLSPQDAQTCLRILSKENRCIEVFYSGKSYMDHRKLEELRRGEIACPCADYLLNTREDVPDIWEFAQERLDRIEAINVIFDAHDRDGRLAMWEVLKEIPGICVTSSMSFNLEIGEKNTSKASALKVLSQYTGIGLEQTMAFGDNDNDLGMLRQAGFSVAMGGALPEVKEAADYVTLSNNEDGVAFVIEALLEKSAVESEMECGKA